MPVLVPVLVLVPVGDVTKVAEGDAVVTGLVGNGVAFAYESVERGPEAPGTDPEWDVYGLIAVDSEEMREERAERRDADAVVSNESGLREGPLVLVTRESARHAGPRRRTYTGPMGVRTLGEAETWPSARAASVARRTRFMAGL